MGAAETIRSRLLYITENNLVQKMGLVIQGDTIQCVMRADFSNPNYGKVEAPVGVLRNWGIDSARLNVSICSVFPYQAVDSIIVDNDSSDLTTGYSTATIPTVQDPGLTMYQLLTNMYNLTPPLNKSFSLYMRQLLFETMYDYSVADKNSFVFISPLLDFDSNGNTYTAPKRITANYSAITQLHLYYEVYSPRTPANQSTQLILPWE